MKTIFLIFGLFLFSFSLTAQKNTEQLPAQDTASASPDKSKTPEIKDFKAPKFPDLPLDPRRKSIQDSIAERRFPGSSRYYGRSLSPYAYGNGFGRSFIVIPDRSSKQYLIVVDPLTGKVSR